MPYALPSARAGYEEPQPVHKPWTGFVPHEDGIIFSQRGSSKLLFVQLPMLEGDCCAAFLFGAHTCRWQTGRRACSLCTC